MNNFQLNHIASLCKYTGISFIAGAITHGFFSGERSFWTATIGIAMYLLSGILEKIANPEKNHTWTNLLAVGIIASIGLGFFTGGLQHFPDSPARSSWVVPIGFAMSLLAMYLIEGKGVVKLKSVLTYGAASLTVVTALSVVTLFYFDEYGTSAHGHSHAQDHGHQNEVKDSTVAKNETTIREIRIVVDNQMRFTPSNWNVNAGETVLITLDNQGQIDHELVIGKEKEILAHAKEMLSPSKKGHQHTNEISAKPGKQASFKWTFKEAGQYAMACFEPGHCLSSKPSTLRTLISNISHRLKNCSVLDHA